MNIFIAFANQDRDVRDKLLRQMNLVKDRQGWNIWSSKEIKAGERWDDEIKQRLMDSEVIVLLLSTDFFNSKYIVETELPKVVEKHRQGDCQIIPVIARVCHWKETVFGEYAELGDIQALPVGEKPIISKGHWDNDDQPYFEVVEGIKESIRAFQAKKRREDATNEVESSQPVPKKQKRGLLVQLATVGVAGLAMALGLLFTKNAPSPIPEIEMPVKILVDTTNCCPLSDTSLLATSKSGLEMVPVQGGTYTMGSPTYEVDRYDNEEVHSVTVGSFSIGKYEVTQADWRKIMGSAPRKLHFKGCDQCPVESVTWIGIQDFIKTLNKVKGKKYRLPTEAEWEYAARGGNKCHGYMYSGSDSICCAGWYQTNGHDQTHPVGQKSPNELGLFDMTGNVWEWCKDFYKPYPNCESISKEDQKKRIARGGSYRYIKQRCRTAYRGYGDPALDIGSDVGFRLAHD